MKRLALLLPALLTACATTVAPVRMNFPSVPEDLTKACPELQQVDPSTTHLSAVVTAVSKNYGQYADCRAQVDSWIVWYNQQKKIYEDAQ
jgi:hypothetical protein